MPSERIYVNAAIQNQEYSLDEKPYKATGILTARTLNQLNGTDTIVHTWNEVGLFSETSRLSMEQRLALKYETAFMRDHLAHRQDDVHVLTDTDAGFSDWAQEVVKETLAAGTTYISEEEFTRCISCNMTIAEVAVSVQQCSKCRQSSGLVVSREEALFTDVPEDRRSLLPYHRLYNKVNVNQELRELNQIPHRLLLSRDRQVGVELGEIGLEGKRLDPRLGIGLLALYVAHSFNYDEAGLVQSLSTVNRTVPYLGSVIRDPVKLGVPDYGYALHAKIKTELFSEQSLQPEHLSLQAIGQRADVNDGARLRAENVAFHERLKTLRENTSELTLPDAPPLNLETGNYTGVVANTNKQLARASEMVKHGRLPDEAEKKLIAAALGAAHILKPIVDTQSK